MKLFPPEKIRNVALVGHGGCGKTTIAEALLHLAGATSRLGRVEDGTTVCDYEAEEQERHQSLSLSMAPFEWKGHKINLIDTPGYADFIGDVRAALRVADLAIVVVSAVEGVEVQTEVVWDLATEMGVPRLIFVNKLDRERADFERTLAQLRERFGAGIAPLELPIGEGNPFRGVADLLSDTAYTYDNGSGPVHGEVPDYLAELEHQVHDHLVEGIVVADDELLERFLEGEVPDVATLEHTLSVGMTEASVFPVVLGSAMREIAIDRLADFICEIGPSPAERPPVEVLAAGSTVEVGANPAGDPLAFVFKTVADPYVGHISLFRVLSGTVHADDHLTNTRTGSDVRLHGLFTLRGKETEPVRELAAGDIAAVAKLGDTLTSDTLAPRGTPVVVPPLSLPSPSLAVAISARTQADEDKLGTVLHRIAEEDPSLVVDRDEESHQTILRGTGELHLQVTIDRLKRRFGVDVDIAEVQVPYRETITTPAKGVEGKLKKQSGGHGQFAVCVVDVEPLERGAGFEFVDRIVGGAISRGYIPAVQKGIEEAMSTGGVFGHPVVDIRVTLVDGKEHSVDSSEMAFKVAGRIALREALAKAAPVLLEPLSLVEVTVPSQNQGDVLGDLNSRRGKVQSSEPIGDGMQEIAALVPTAEIRRYAVELRSLTGGRGRFTAEHDHYDVLPPHLVDSVRRTTRDSD